MNIESHLACGWLLAQALPGSSRRERLVITLAAVVSDVDGLTNFVSENMYAQWHHTVGHNVFAAEVVGLLAVAILRGRRWGLILLVTQLAFWSHMAGDYFFSGWNVMVFWPVSSLQGMYRPAMGLDHPITIGLSYAGFLAMGASIWWFGRTPLEFVWPRLDALLVRMLKRGKLVCHLCGRRTGVECAACGRPMCLRHGGVKRGLRTICQECQAVEVGH